MPHSFTVQNLSLCLSLCRHLNQNCFQLISFLVSEKLHALKSVESKSVMRDQLIYLFALLCPQQAGEGLLPHELTEGVEGIAGGFIYTIQGKSADSIAFDVMITQEL